MKNFIKNIIIGENWLTFNMNITELRLGDVIEDKKQNKFIFYLKQELTGLTPGINLIFLPIDKKWLSWVSCFIPNINKSNFNSEVEVLETYSFDDRELVFLRRLFGLQGEVYGLSSKASSNWIKTYDYIKNKTTWKRKS